MRAILRLNVIYSLTIILLMGGLLACSQETPPEETTAEVAMEAEGDRGLSTLTLNGTKITIDYGRPKMEGRDLLSMAPDGFTWRFGKDDVTKFSTDANLKFGDKVLPVGEYSASVKRVEGDNWNLILNSKLEMGADTDTDVLVAPFDYSNGHEITELFTIDLIQQDDGGLLSAKWGEHHLNAAFKTE